MPSALPNTRPATPEGKPVRIEVRVGSERATDYQFADSEFLIGGAEACDLRLRGAHLPQVICRISRSVNGLQLVRHELAFPILVNGEVVSESGPILLSSGDRIAIGSADLTIVLPDQHLRPRFVALPPEPPPASRAPLTPPEEPQPEPRTLPFPSPDVATLAAEREELTRWRAELEEQARELETDRVTWYRRRQEMEAEYRQFREQPDTTAQQAELARREAELDQVRDELTEIRHKLVAQYQERRDQLDQMQEMVRRSTESLNDRQKAFDEECARRTKALDDRERQPVAPVANPADLALVERNTDLARREEQYQEERRLFSEDLLRQNRLKAHQTERQRELDRRAEEIDRQYERLRRDTAELEEHVRLAGAEQDRNEAETVRLEKLRADLEAQSVRLAERSAQVEAQQAMLAVLRARLDRRQDEIRTETTQLVADRSRMDDAQRDLDHRLRDSERLRAELATAREGQVEQESQIAERTAWLDATLAEIQQQKDALAAEQARLAAKEADLDTRTADIAEQTAVLKARVSQVMDLQERLEADRSAVRERESTLTDADTARQTFQEQLRRRSEELSARTRQSDELAQRLAQDRAELDRKQAELNAAREETEQTLTRSREDLDRRTADLSAREAALERQVARLRDAGRGVAAARKELAESRQAWDAERVAAQDQLATAQAEWSTRHAQALNEIAELRKQAPELEERVQTSIDSLTAARGVLRGHLNELSAFAGQTRQELDALRSDVLQREQVLEAARAEHRLAVTEFRQQLHDWQSRVNDLKAMLARGETRLETREAEVQAAARQVTVTSVDLARQAEELRAERQLVSERRTEVERHLTDMREWYRQKLRELAESRAKPVRNEQEPTILQLHDEPEEIEPGDKQLGDLLRASELVDSETLAGLWAEAQRQRRTLRQVLLASGAITLYQLALIEAGNLDALMLGRLRVIDRIRVTAHEAIYRVYDPTRANSSTRGGYVLRHLAEAEMDDAVRPDEFRQRFAAACEAAHPNLAATLEVLEINGRPAVLQEWLAGLPGSEWPAEVATPGVWVWLLSAAAAGLDAAHHGGLVHGRLTSDSLLMGANGVLKITGLADPPWLVVGPQPNHEVTPGSDLRDLGQIAAGWSLLGATAKRRSSKSRGFPDSLLAVIRRLEADSESPMGDTTAGVVPYTSAGELVADLSRLAAAFPCPPDAWERFLQHVAENSTDDGTSVRKSA